MTSIISHNDKNYLFPNIYGLTPFQDIVETKQNVTELQREHILELPFLKKYNFLETIADSNNHSDIIKSWYISALLHVDNDLKESIHVNCLKQNDINSLHEFLVLYQELNTLKNKEEHEIFKKCLIYYIHTHNFNIAIVDNVLITIKNKETVCFFNLNSSSCKFLGISKPSVFNSFRAPNKKDSFLEITSDLDVTKLTITNNNYSSYFKYISNVLNRHDNISNQNEFDFFIKLIPDVDITEKIDNYKNNLQLLSLNLNNIDRNNIIISNIINEFDGSLIFQNDVLSLF